MTTPTPPTPPPSLPSRCDVLVIGAGPAGSACAQRLAAAGVDVVLVDQHVFPRDKVCGDGLIPDAHAALRRLGVYDEVAALARPVAQVRFVGPRSGHVDVPGLLSVLPRKTLDHILVRAAARAGARLSMPARFESPLLDGDRVVGAVLDCGGTRCEISARWVVLASGALPQALIAAGLCERHTPTGVAMRGYVRNDALVGRITQLQMVWHRRLRGGYGWIFPAPGGVFNIGVGLINGFAPRADARDGRRDGNLRAMLDAFSAVYAPAAELLSGGVLQGTLKGAPLRCTLQGARWSRPGMLACGEAIGSTYAMSGEGIGKALETGMLAADALLQAHALPSAAQGASDSAVQQTYAATLRALQPKFDLYQTASRVNQHPWIADIVIWRARRSARILKRLSGILDETQSPGHLFSWRGVTKLLFE